MLLSLIFAIAPKNEMMKPTNIIAPKADKKPVKLEKHGDVRIDDYFWMRLSDAQKLAAEKDDQTTNVVDYLNAENNYYEERTGHILWTSDDTCQSI